MRILQGTVISNTMQKTVVVRVDRLLRHPRYGKFMRRSARFKAQVEDAAAYYIGDVVRIAETRPLSKEKRWKVIEVVRRAPAPEVEAESGSL